MAEEVGKADQSSVQKKPEDKKNPDDELDLLSAPRKQLLLLITKSLEAGKNEKAIQSDLIKAGWSKTMVKELMDEAQNSGQVAKAGYFKRKEGEAPVPILKDAPIIRFEEVSKAFDENIVLNKINLEIKAGEIFGIIGLSGSGKSTMLNLIIGFYYADEGKVIYRTPGSPEYKSVVTHPDEVKNLIGFSPQDASFYSNLTAEENLFYFGSLYGLSSQTLRQNVYALLDLVELTSSRKTLAKHLSGGMQRRLSIACALIHEPKILVLDEPTADLDPVIRQDIWEVIEKIHEKGTTVILTSHLLSELETLCDRVAIIHNGGILRLGTPLEIKNLYTHAQEIVIETMMGEYTPIMDQIKKMRLPVKKMVVEHNRLVMMSDSAEEVLHKVLNILEKRSESVIDITLNKPSLSEVFSNLVKHKKDEPET